MRKLFTERHGQALPRVAEALDEGTRNALLTLVSARNDEESFGLSFPDKYGDGYAYAGTDLTRLRDTMKGYGVLWPREVDRENPPDGRPAALRTQPVQTASSDPTAPKRWMLFDSTLRSEIMLLGQGFEFRPERC